jgi:2-dehydro-3-deoxygluconokinase
MSVDIRPSGFAALGECMLELSEPSDRIDATQLQLGFGGDTLNTALYVARLGVPSSYVTAVGDDYRSDWMLARWQHEGISTDLVARFPGRQPGLYWITTTPEGERSFAYWRKESPARELFDEPNHVTYLTNALASYGIVYLTGISLSLYNAAARERMFTALQRLRDQGVTLCFDGNFRPAGWSSASEAREAFERACRLMHIVLPTFEDEQALFGDVSPTQTADRLRGWGVDEVVVKLGRDGCLVADVQRIESVNTEVIGNPVDTTAAGDSFSAGYLAGRYNGLPPNAAAALGNQLAGVVIMHRGAIVPRSAMPERKANVQ